MKHFKTITYMALTACLLSLCSCASLTRAYYNKDMKQGVNLVTTQYNTPELEVNINGKPVVAKRIYDGSENQSPFTVYRARTGGSPKKLEVKTQSPSGGNSYIANRKRSKGWFWIEGLGVIVDYFTGGVYYYPDVNLDGQ